MSSDDPERQNGMMVTFRLAGSEDAKKLAEIRCKSWKSAYRGIYPDEMLIVSILRVMKSGFESKYRMPKRRYTLFKAAAAQSDM